MSMVNTSDERKHAPSMAGMTYTTSTKRPPTRQFSAHHRPTSPLAANSFGPDDFSPPSSPDLGRRGTTSPSVDTLSRTPSVPTSPSAYSPSPSPPSHPHHASYFPNPTSVSTLATGKAEATASASTSTEALVQARALSERLAQDYRSYTAEYFARSVESTTSEGHSLADSDSDGEDDRESVALASSSLHHTTTTSSTGHTRASHQAPFLPPGLGHTRTPGGAFGSIYGYSALAYGPPVYGSRGGRQGHARSASEPATSGPPNAWVSNTSNPPPANSRVVKHASVPVPAQTIRFQDAQSGISHRRTSTVASTSTSSSVLEGYLTEPLVLPSSRSGDENDDSGKPEKGGRDVDVDVDVFGLVQPLVPPVLDGYETEPFAFVPPPPPTVSPLTAPESSLASASPSTTTMQTTTANSTPTPAPSAPPPTQPLNVPPKRPQPIPRQTTVHLRSGPVVHPYPIPVVQPTFGGGGVIGSYRGSIRQGAGLPSPTFESVMDEMERLGGDEDDEEDDASSFHTASSASSSPESEEPTPRPRMRPLSSTNQARRRSSSMPPPLGTSDDSIASTVEVGRGLDRQDEEMGYTHARHNTSARYAVLRESQRLSRHSRHSRHASDPTSTPNLIGERGASWVSQSMPDVSSASPYTSSPLAGVDANDLSYEAEWPLAYLNTVGGEVKRAGDESRSPKKKRKLSLSGWLWGRGPQSVDRSEGEGVEENMKRERKPSKKLRKGRPRARASKDPVPSTDAPATGETAATPLAMQTAVPLSSAAELEPNPPTPRPSLDRSKTTAISRSTSRVSTSTTRATLTSPSSATPKPKPIPTPTAHTHTHTPKKKKSKEHQDRLRRLEKRLEKQEKKEKKAKADKMREMVFGMDNLSERRKSSVYGTLSGGYGSGSGFSSRVGSGSFGVSRVGSGSGLPSGSTAIQITALDSELGLKNASAAAGVVDLRKEPNGAEEFGHRRFGGGMLEGIAQRMRGRKTKVKKADAVGLSVDARRSQDEEERGLMNVKGVQATRALVLAAQNEDHLRDLDSDVVKGDVAMVDGVLEADTKTVRPQADPRIIQPPLRSQVDTDNENAGVGSVVPPTSAPIIIHTVSGSTVVIPPSPPSSPPQIPERLLPPTPRSLDGPLNLPHTTPTKSTLPSQPRSPTTVAYPPPPSAPPLPPLARTTSNSNSSDNESEPESDPTVVAIPGQPNFVPLNWCGNGHMEVGSAPPVLSTGASLPRRDGGDGTGGGGSSGGVPPPPSKPPPSTQPALPRSTATHPALDPEVKQDTVARSATEEPGRPSPRLGLLPLIGAKRWSRKLRKKRRVGGAGEADERSQLPMSADETKDEAVVVDVGVENGGDKGEKVEVNEVNEEREEVLEDVVVDSVRLPQVEDGNGDHTHDGVPGVEEEEIMQENKTPGTHPNASEFHDEFHDYDRDRDSFDPDDVTDPDYDPLHSSLLLETIAFPPVPQHIPSPRSTSSRALSPLPLSPLVHSPPLSPLTGSPLFQKSAIPPTSTDDEDEGERSTTPRPIPTVSPIATGVATRSTSTSFTLPPVPSSPPPLPPVTFVSPINRPQSGNSTTETLRMGSLASLASLTVPEPLTTTSDLDMHLPPRTFSREFDSTDSEGDSSIGKESIGQVREVQKGRRVSVGFPVPVAVRTTGVGMRYPVSAPTVPGADMGGSGGQGQNQQPLPPVMLVLPHSHGGELPRAQQLQARAQPQPRQVQLIPQLHPQSHPHPHPRSVPSSPLRHEAILGREEGVEEAEVEVKNEDDDEDEDEDDYPPRIPLSEKGKGRQVDVVSASDEVGVDVRDEIPTLDADQDENAAEDYDDDDDDLDAFDPYSHPGRTPPPPSTPPTTGYTTPRTPAYTPIGSRPLSLIPEERRLTWADSVQDRESRRWTKMGGVGENEDEGFASEDGEDVFVDAKEEFEGSGEGAGVARVDEAVLEPAQEAVAAEDLNTEKKTQVEEGTKKAKSGVKKKLQKAPPAGFKPRSKKGERPEPPSTSPLSQNEADPKSRKAKPKSNSKRKSKSRDRPRPRSYPPRPVPPRKPSIPTLRPPRTPKSILASLRLKLLFPLLSLLHVTHRGGDGVAAGLSDQTSRRRLSRELRTPNLLVKGRHFSEKYIPRYPSRLDGVRSVEKRVAKYE